MADFNVKSDGVNVEQLMEQIRGRIREKRGVDYTEQELRELAAVKLEKFLDPRAVRSDLLEQFRKSKPPEFPVYALSEAMLFETHRPALRLIRRIFRPILKLFFNPNRMVQAINEMVAKNQEARYNADHLSYEVLHNAVIELTRLGIELRNLKMRVESLAGRLELNERRERALEGVVMYQPGGDERYETGQGQRAVQHHTRQAAPPTPRGSASSPSIAPIGDDASGGSSVPGPTPVAGTAGTPEGPGQRSRRRRRRRGRRGTGLPRPGVTQTEAGGANEVEAADSGPDDGPADGSENPGPAETANDGDA
jgi:hypothetical protein